MTLMTGGASDVTGKAIASNASLVLGETRLTTFGTDAHGRGIDHENTSCHVRVIQAGRPAARTSTTITGRARPPAVSYDVAGGPSVMGPRDTAIARIDEMISGNDIVKLSDRDLTWLRPGDGYGDAVRWLMSLGPAVLVVTHGDASATGYARSGSVDVRGHRVEVIDTVEWEDAFVAGLLHALTVRDLLPRGTDRSLRTIGLDDLRGILDDASIWAARVVTPAGVWPPLTAAPAEAGSLTKTG